MNLLKTAAIAAIATMTSCSSGNPFLTESPLPYEAPQFNLIENEHYLPAFKEGIAQAKAEIDAITNNQEEPTFQNTSEAFEYSGKLLNDVALIFYNLMECNTNDEMQKIAEEIAPMMTEYQMYVSLNEKLFQRIKTLYDKRETLGLEQDQLRLLEKQYEDFARNGANLSPEDKVKYVEYQKELSLLTLEFSKNSLAAANAFSMNITDEAQLEGLPDYVKESAAEAAKAKNLEGWLFDLSYPSYLPFMQFSTNRELREKMYRAYASKAVGGESDNSDVCKKIANVRYNIAKILGYENYAQYAIEPRMAKTQETVEAFLQKLIEPALQPARNDVANIKAFAKASGADYELMPWDFTYWSEKYKASKFALDDEMLKPYFRLENCIAALFDLANRLYGISFEETNLPAYHPDVKVYDVKEEDGSHLGLLYADFFPRPSKRDGAWMTEFRPQKIELNGNDPRPIINMVTNFTKPTANKPSLITHDEFTTLLHEFGHVLNGLMAQGRYTSICGTNVARDFVELPSQIMENWAFQAEYLNTFAKHYETGETIPAEYIEKIAAARNYNAAYTHIRQLQYGTLDMAWYTLTSVPEVSTEEFERTSLKQLDVMPRIEGCASSTTFSHIFSGGYSAGYYSYKWAEVLEADGFSLFQEKGIFNKEVANSFRKNILEKGDLEDADVLYRKFRGHDPQPEALLRKLGIIE